MKFNIITGIIGIFIVYVILKYLLSVKLNYSKYKEIMIDFKSGTSFKIKGLSFIKKISYFLNETDISFKVKNKNIITTFSIIFISTLIFTATFLVTYNFFDLFIPSIIFSTFTFFFPYFIIKYFSYQRRNRILKMFPNYLINLKNYTDVNNDIVEAFRRADVDEPLNKYINKFNVSLQKGVKIYDAFETLKANIGIKQMNQFITLLQFCYIYGGNFGDLIEKFSKIQMKNNLQREKEKQKTFSSKLVLLILLILNVYILFGFILSNKEYYYILIKTFMGNLILNINILSYIFIFYMYMKLNSMEE